MKPLDEYIRNSSVIVFGTGHEITSEHFVRSNGSIAINPGVPVVINITIENERDFELTYLLDGGGDFNNVEITDSDNYSAEITIKTPKRADDDELLSRYNLTLKIEGDNRPMYPYELPPIAVFFINANLESFTVNQTHIILQETDLAIMEFDQKITEYIILLKHGTENVNITANVPEGVYSSYRINGSEPLTEEETRTVTWDNSNKIEIEVTAELDEVVKYYYFTVEIVPPPVAEDFEYEGLGIITYDGTPKPVTITSKPGKTQGDITIWYEGINVDYPKSADAPADGGHYQVTFDVEEYAVFVSAEGLEAPEYLSIFYNNNDLETFVINSINNEYEMIWQDTIEPYFDSSFTDYIIEVPYGTQSLNITTSLPAKLNSSYAINGGDVNGGTDTRTVEWDVSNKITIEVTADSGLIKTYSFTVEIVPPPVVEDFIISGLGTNTYDGMPVPVFITPKEGKTPGAITIYYEGINGTSYAKTTTAPTNVGTYRATFNVAASGNFIAAPHADAEFIAGEFTIASRGIEFGGGFKDENIDLTVNSENYFRNGDNVYISVSGDFDYYYWYRNGNLYTSGSNNSISFNIDSGMSRGIHTVTVIVTKNGVPYSKEVKFRVVW